MKTVAKDFTPRRAMFPKLVLLVDALHKLNYWK